MKLRATSLLLLTLAANPGLAFAEVSRMGEDSLTTIVPEMVSLDGVTIVELNEQPPGASALDLSLFGVISLGIIGLLWIRRHTSQL